MNRRQFLKAAQYTAIGALVASVYPPTAWGRFDKKLHVNPKAVGLTTSDQASVSNATQVLTGTELFQDTIYAQPVVAANAVNSHALIEGARGRSRIQSDLLSDNPDEYQFLDRGYHFGPPELIQIEQDESGNWELVHYHHPWGPRTDGARTDGLIRQVISSDSDTLTNPRKVVAITGTYTNHFFPQQSSLSITVSYMVYVEDVNGGHLFIGHGISSVPSPYNKAVAYPVHWSSGSPNVFFGNADNYLFADKYTSAGWISPGNFSAPVYAAEQQVEHLVLYYTDFIGIITLLDVGGADPGITATQIPLPSGVSNPRVVHIDWDPTQANTSDWRRLTNVVLASSEKQSSGDAVYTLFMMNQAGNTSTSGQEFFTPLVTYTKITFADNWKKQLVGIPADSLQNGDLFVDYPNLRSVHGLYTTIVDGTWYHVKLVNFQGRGVFLLVIARYHAPDVVESYPEFFLGGHFPLAFPDAAGVGTITALSGGTSKFSGFRYVASDADGNVFIMRQRRYTGSGSPYAPPIYAQNTASGTPLTSWYTNELQLPKSTSATSNLRDLDAWWWASSQGADYTYNFLLYAALAFSTDDTSESQAVWLGNTFQAAYASKRFALDSEHVVVKKVQSGETDVYAAFTMFKNPLTKTWHQRQIAAQILPEDLGIQESGDHYQATVTPANTYGRMVSLYSDGTTNTDNANLLIEVRADSPCTVIDDTNNLYYDVDRYTSFMTTPDPATGHLCLLVKAETFSQVLYVRLVDTSGLQPSNDEAMLSATSETAYAWQSVNLALQAQQRMGNGAQSSSLLDDSTDRPDKTTYVTGESLYDNNPDAPWKGDFSQQDMQANLGHMATYLNTSAQNLTSATGQLSLGASPDGVTIDPLYAVTAVPSDSSRPTVTTQFAYNKGLVTTTTASPTTMYGGQLGSLWSSISHALHDALHWLRHAESAAYKELASGGVSIVSAVDSITVTVGKDMRRHAVEPGPSCRRRRAGRTRRHSVVPQGADRYL
jgi:hypothetical protein